VEWNEAVMLCGCPLARGCVLDSNIREKVKHQVELFFQYAKTRSRGNVFNGTQVTSTVAALGILQKNKQFSFKTGQAEDMP